jgi:hypothetical protein
MDRMRRGAGAPLYSSPCTNAGYAAHVDRCQACSEPIVCVKCEAWAVRPIEFALNG